MTRAPLSPAVVKMWSKVRRVFALIWKLNLVIQKKSEFLGVEVALGLYAPLNASSCTRNNGPGGEWFIIGFGGSSLFEVRRRAHLKGPGLGDGGQEDSWYSWVHRAST